MQWIQNFHLFLFDFDGLLADTESLHFRAYQQICLSRNLELPWSFDKFCTIAHSAHLKLEDALYADLAELKRQEPNWPKLYQEKGDALKYILHSEGAALMPGVEKLLQILDETGVKRAVVTHSADWIVQSVRDRHEILNSIPSWITREHYSHPKPNPECYKKAIQLLGVAAERAIGFEDTPRGTEALLGAGVKAVIVTRMNYEELPRLIARGVTRCSSLSDLLVDAELLLLNE